MTIELNSKNLEAFLLARGNINPDIFLPSGSNIILCADAALQIKSKGDNYAMGIIRKGIPFLKTFEMVGYDPSKIDYSCNEREMEKPVMEDSEAERLRGKEVLLVDDDYGGGETLHKVIEFLGKREIKVNGVFVAHKDCKHDPFETWVSDKKGLRRLKKGSVYGDRIKQEKNDMYNDEEYEEDVESVRFKIPRNIRVFTSTDSSKIDEATERVLRYFSSATNI